MFQYCPSVAIKVGLTFDMFSNVIFSMDNGRNSNLYESALEGKVILKLCIIHKLLNIFVNYKFLFINGMTFFWYFRFLVVLH